MCQSANLAVVIKVVPLVKNIQQVHKTQIDESISSSSMEVIGGFLGKLHVLRKILDSRCFHVAWQILIDLIVTPLIQCSPLLKLGLTSTFHCWMLLVRW